MDCAPPETSPRRNLPTPRPNLRLKEVAPDRRSLLLEQLERAMRGGLDTFVEGAAKARFLNDEPGVIEFAVGAGEPAITELQMHVEGGLQAALREALNLGTVLAELGIDPDLLARWSRDDLARPSHKQASEKLGHRDLYTPEEDQILVSEAGNQPVHLGSWVPAGPVPARPYLRVLLPYVGEVARGLLRPAPRGRRPHTLRFELNFSALLQALAQTSDPALLGLGEAFSARSCATPPPQPTLR